MRAIMISVKPKYVAKILNGDKSVEVRKNKALASAIQKLIDENGYADIYVYCSKDKKHKLEYCDINDGCWCANDGGEYYNGKVVFKFRCYKVEEIKLVNIEDYSSDTYEYQTNSLNEYELCLKSCLNGIELNNYLQNKLSGFAIYISKLEIFDRPKELSGFRNAFKYKRVESVFGNNNIEKDERTGGLRQPVKGGYEYVYPLTKAPQSWCYVEVE